MNATDGSFTALAAVEPVLTEIAPLRALRPPPEATLLHAGPPLADPTAPPQPLLNSIAAAAALEGWAASRAETLAALGSGALRLAPAQDHAVVTPLAFVVGPSTPCLKVVDAARPTAFKLSPLSDGPAPAALRFGHGAPEGVALIRALIDEVAAQLASTLRPLALLPEMAAALREGDELHGRVSALQARLRPAFVGTPAPAARYLETAPLALNAMMAAAALMLAAGARGGGRMIVACGGNGVALGVKRADAPERWETRPAPRPIGPRLPGREGATPLPAIGDSAVIDALGFGAACLRYCPELSAALQPQIDAGALSPAFLDARAHEPFLGPHPALGDDAIRLGLDPERPHAALGIMLGMVEETGVAGLIGRGIAPWPAA